MNKVQLNTLLLLVSLMALSCKTKHLPSGPEAISSMMGAWKDDYDISYIIEENTWKLGSDITFHIIEWNQEKQFLIVKNDESNAYNAGMYSRIDYLILNDMDPYTWAYCLTAYDKPTEDLARSTPQADVQNPKTGCNGFPFSRMKRN